MPVALTRRSLLQAASAAAVLRCGQPPSAPGGEVASPPKPRLLSSELVRSADGTMVRRFSGPAAPEDAEIRDLFPNAHCPFGVDTSRQLGEGGYGLEIVDRTLSGELPADAPWALNMVPFGVAIDGVLIDPSGPWHDGGPPDPRNPMDRTCSGWEYCPLSPPIGDLLGIPPDVRGHVQPGPMAMPGASGLFHYHGAPRRLLERLRVADPSQPLVVGYSADGFWIIDAVVKPRHFFSGWVLREGRRAALPRTNPALVPAGEYDGTYVQDWVYDPVRKRALIDAELRANGRYHELTRDELRAGRSELVLLDERNGLVISGLPGAPERAYVYVLTPDWPEVPRIFAREPSQSFRRVIPLGPPGRASLYDACPPELAGVHQWNGRDRY